MYTTKNAPPPPPPPPASYKSQAANIVSQRSNNNNARNTNISPPPPPQRTRHYRSNSDSSIMEPPQLRQPTRPSNPSNSRLPPQQYSSSRHREPERAYNDDRPSHRRASDDRAYYKDEQSSSSRRSKHHTSSSEARSSNRHRSSKDKKPRGKSVHLDTIDKLDVTGFFGPGSFHHDGPFDACTPHRNKNNKKAPVAAFPINGANNSLALDPNRDRYTAESNILMQGDNPAYQDFSSGVANSTAPMLPRANKSETSVTFDPTLKATQVHGDTTMGLGSSTFLEGTPAPKTAVENAAALQQASTNLSRKKSLVQKLRGSSGNAPPRPPRLNVDSTQGASGASSNNINNNVATTKGRGGTIITSSPPLSAASASGSRRRDSETSAALNPKDKSSVTVKVSSPDVVSWNHKNDQSPMSPNEDARSSTPPSKTNGLLRRVKSLKSSSRRS